MARFFSSYDFNRVNFNLFIGDLLKNYTNSYINRFIALGKHIDKFLKINQLQDYTYFQEDRSITCETLTPEEIERIADTQIPYKKFCEILNQRYKALYRLLGGCGMRISEALNLKHSDVVDSTPPRIIIRETKNYQTRVIPITKRTLDILKNLPKNSSDFLFTSARTGKQLNPQEINLDLKRRCLALGIKKRVWNHLLRHSYITSLHQAGVGLMEIGYLVGHKSSDSTLRYIHNDLDYYNGIIYQHPMFKREVTWEDTKERVRNKVSQIVDTSRFPLRIEEKEGKLTIEVGRGKEKATLKRTASSYPLLS